MPLYALAWGHKSDYGNHIISLKVLKTKRASPAGKDSFLVYIVPHYVLFVHLNMLYIPFVV